MYIYKNIHPNKTFLTEAFFVARPLPILKHFQVFFFKYFITKRQFFSPYQQVFIFSSIEKFINCKAGSSVQNQD